eukprot:3551781-Rhodomonas_salina.1
MPVTHDMQGVSGTEMERRGHDIYTRCAVLTRTSRTRRRGRHTSIRSTRCAAIYCDTRPRSICYIYIREARGYLF